MLMNYSFLSNGMSNLIRHLMRFSATLALESIVTDTDFSQFTSNAYWTIPSIMRADVYI